MQGLDFTAALTLASDKRLLAEHQPVKAETCMQSPTAKKLQDRLQAV